MSCTAADLSFDVKNGKKIALSDFTINLSARVLTGIVNGNANARVPVFTLGLAHATLKAHKHVVAARGIPSAAPRPRRERWTPRSARPCSRPGW